MVLPSDHTVHVHSLQKNLKSVEELWSALTFRHLSSASLRHCLSIREAREPTYRRDFGITQGLDQHVLAEGSRAGQQPLPTSVSSSLWAKGQLASLPSVTSPLWQGPVTLVETVEHPASDLETVEHPAVTAGHKPRAARANLHLAGRWFISSSIELQMVTHPTVSHL